MAPERGKKSPFTVAAECGADEILIVNIDVSNQLKTKFKLLLLYVFRIVMIQDHWNQIQLQHQNSTIF